MMVFGLSRYERKLRRLQRERARTTDECDRGIAAAKKEERSLEEIAERTRDFSLISERLSDLIANAQHALLIRKAERLLIPTPEFRPHSKDVEECSTTGRLRFNSHARQRLREAIEQAEDRKAERRRWWATTFISCASMAIAFLALLVALNNNGN